MAISFAKINEIKPLQVREVKSIDPIVEVGVISNDVDLYVESTNMKKDSEGNMWVYSPITKMYYEFYRKIGNVTMMTIYPTIYAEVTSDCKVGVTMFSDHSHSSNEILKRMPGENYSITSNFYVDTRGTIWVKSIELTKTEEGYSKLIGWIPYKNKRNNFTNLLIHGKYNVVTTNGELDTDKVDAFQEYIMNLRFTWMYEFDTPLQIFSNKTKSKTSVKTGNGKSAKAKSHPGNDQSVNTDSNRREFSFKGRNHTVKTITKNAKDVVQNSKSFPSTKGSVHGIPQYNYFMDYDKDKILENMDQIRANLNLDIQTPDALFNKLTTMYNRFKLANPNDVLSRGFPHVFFTRPDCNIFGDTKGSKLTSKVGANPNFKYAFCHKKKLIQQLSQVNSQSWLWYLSNKALSFNPTDENIGTDKYGTTYRKNSIAYGKDNNESKAAGEISLDFQDTRDLDVLNLHKLWVDYISNVFLGKWMPKHEYIWNKELDYASSCYYIITAEDGETIIFWTKYYGCFPVNIPSSAYGWSEGSPISSQKLNVTYEYSFKEDLNPLALVELNINSGINPNNDIEYYSMYNPNLGTTGTTWVGEPFIETINKEGSNDYYFKLRYKK